VCVCHVAVLSEDAKQIKDPHTLNDLLSMGYKVISIVLFGLDSSRFGQRLRVVACSNQGWNGQNVRFLSKSRVETGVISGSTGVPTRCWASSPAFTLVLMTFLSSVIVWR
jgi:hypothetical protein